MKSYRKYIPLGLLLAWMFLMYILSSQNGEQTASTSSGIAKWVAGLFYKEPTGVQINDIHMLVRKLAHVILYFGFGILSFYAFTMVWESRRYVSTICAILLTVVTAIVDEWHKVFTPGRHCDGGEILLNAVSGLLAIGCCILVSRLWKRRKEK